MTLSLLLMLALPPVSELETEIRSYDLRLASPVVEANDSYVRLLPVLPPPGADRNVDGEELECDPDMVVGILYELFEQEFEYEGRWINHTEDDRLIVSAPAAVQAEIARVLGFLERAFSRALTIELHLIDLPPEQAAAADALGTRLTSSRAEQLIGRARASGTHEAVTVRVRPGRSTAIDLTRELSLVRSYGVEIAEKSVAFDPMVESVSIGTRLSLRASARPGGARVLLSLSSGRLLGEVREIELAGASQITGEGRLLFGDLGQAIQTCDVANRSLALATFLPAGEFVAIAQHDARADRGGRRWLLMTLRAEPEASPVSLAVGQRTLQVYDLERIAGPRWSLDSFFGPSYGRPRSGLQQWDDEVNFGDDDLAVAVGTSGPDYDIAYEIAMQGDDDWVASQGPWNVTAHAQPFSYAAAEAVARSNEVHDLNLRLMLGGVEVSTVRWSTLDGEECVAVVGAETVVVGDMDTEVAQSAGAYQPQARHVFDGVVVRARAVRALDGSLIVDVAVRGHLLEGPIDDFDTRGPLSGRIQEFRHRNLMLADRVVFDAAGQSYRLGDTEGGLALELKLD